MEELRVWVAARLRRDWGCGGGPRRRGIRGQGRKLGPPRPG